MAQLRLIKIVTLANGTVAFQPDTHDGQPQQPLGVLLNDRVHWNNETNDTHRLVVTSNSEFLTNEVPPGRVSNPGVIVNTQRIDYKCALHPGEQGAIVAVDAPSPQLFAASLILPADEVRAIANQKPDQTAGRKKPRRKRSGRKKTRRA